MLSFFSTVPRFVFYSSAKCSHFRRLEDRLNDPLGLIRIGANRWTDERSLFSIKDEGIPGNLLSSLREIHCLICSTLHQMFIADPKVAKLVHFQVIFIVWSRSNRKVIENSLQGYPSELIPVFVGGVPSMHICLDFIPELLQQKDIRKQLFAIQLSSHLCVHFPVPKSLSTAQLCVHVLSTFVTGTVYVQLYFLDYFLKILTDWRLLERRTCQ